MGDLVLRAVLVTVCGLAATWAATTVERVCPAVYPAPASCFVDRGPTLAAWGTGVLTGMLVAFVVLALFRVPTVVGRASLVVLGGAAVTAPVVTLVSGGFGPGTEVLLVAVCAVAVVFVVLGAFGRNADDGASVD
jgi:hypothetical protein